MSMSKYTNKKGAERVSFMLSATVAKSIYDELKSIDFSEHPALTYMHQLLEAEFGSQESDEIATLREELAQLKAQLAEKSDSASDSSTPKVKPIRIKHP